MSKQIKGKNRFALLDEVQKVTLRKVLRYMKKYIPLLIISVVLATITVAMTLYFPILTGKALDLIVEKLTPCFFS